MIFDPLSHEQLRMVARLQMKEVAYRLAERGVALAVTDAALDLILSLSYDPVCEHINVTTGNRRFAKCRGFVECILLDTR